MVVYCNIKYWCFFIIFFFINKIYFGKEVKNDMERIVIDVGVDNFVCVLVGFILVLSDIFYIEWMEREE